MSTPPVLPSDAFVNHQPPRATGATTTPVSHPPTHLHLTVPNATSAPSPARQLHSPLQGHQAPPLFHLNPINSKESISSPHTPATPVPVTFQCTFLGPTDPLPVSNSFVFFPLFLSFNIAPNAAPTISLNTLQVDVRSSCPNVCFFAKPMTEVQECMHALCIPTDDSVTLTFGETKEVCVGFNGLRPTPAIPVSTTTTQCIDFNAHLTLSIPKDMFAMVIEERVGLKWRVCASVLEVDPTELVATMDNTTTPLTYEVTVRNKSEIPLKYQFTRVINNPKYNLAVLDYDHASDPVVGVQILDSYNTRRYLVSVRLAETQPLSSTTNFTGNFLVVDNLHDDRTTAFIPIQCTLRSGAREEYITLTSDGVVGKTVSLGRCFIGSTISKIITISNITSESLLLSLPKKIVPLGTIEFAMDGDATSSSSNAKHAIPVVDVVEDGSDDDREKVASNTSGVVEEITMNAGQVVGLMVRFTPSLETLKESATVGLKESVDIIATKGGAMPRNFSITCRGTIVSSRISVDQEVLNFRDTAVGTAKVVHVTVQNQADIDGGVRVEYDSKILFLTNSEAKQETPVGSGSHKVYVVPIPASKTIVLDFEICPVRVNPRYTKQIKITNLTNTHDYHVLTVRSNNIAGAGESFHAKYYTIEATKRSRVQQQSTDTTHSISMKRSIFFTYAIANFPTIRSFTLSNHHPAALTLNLTPLEDNGMRLFLLQPQDPTRRTFLESLIEKFETDNYLRVEGGEEILTLRSQVEKAIASKEFCPVSELRLGINENVIVYVLVHRKCEEISKKTILMKDGIRVVVTHLGDALVEPAMEPRTIHVMYQMCSSVIDIGQRNVNLGVVQYGERNKRMVTLTNNCEVPLYFYMQKSKSVNASHIRTDGVSHERYFCKANPFAKKDVEITYFAGLKGKFNEQIRVVNILNEDDVHIITIKAEVEKLETFDVKPTSANLGLLYVGDLPETAHILTTPANQGKCSFTVTNTSKTIRTMKIRLDPERCFRCSSAEIVTLTFGFEERAAGEGSTRKIEEEIEKLEHKLKIQIRKKKLDKLEWTKKRLDMLRRKLNGETVEEDNMVADAPSDDDAFEAKPVPMTLYSTEDPEIAEALREGLVFPNPIPHGAEVIVHVTVTFRRPTNVSGECEPVTALLYVSESRDVESSRTLEIKASLTVKWDEYKRLELSTGKNAKIELRSLPVASTTAAPIQTPSSPLHPSLVTPTDPTEVVPQKSFDFGSVVLDRVAKQVIPVQITTPMNFVILAPTPSGSGCAKFRFFPPNGTLQPGDSIEVLCTPQKVGRQIYRCQLQKLDTPKLETTVTFTINGLNDHALSFPSELDFDLVYVKSQDNSDVVRSFLVTNKIGKKLFLTAKSNTPIQLQVFTDRTCTTPATAIPIVDKLILYARLFPRLEASCFESGKCREYNAGIQISAYDPKRDDPAACDIPRVTEFMDVRATIGYSSLKLLSQPVVNLGRVCAAKYEHQSIVVLSNRSQKLPLEFVADTQGHEITIPKKYLKYTLGAGETVNIPVTLAAKSYGMIEEFVSFRNVSNPSQQPVNVTFVLFADDSSVKTDLQTDDLNFEVVDILVRLHPSSKGPSSTTTGPSYVIDSTCKAKKLIKLSCTKDLVLVPMSKCDVTLTAREEPPQEVKAKPLRLSTTDELVEVGAPFMLERRSVKMLYMHAVLRRDFSASEKALLAQGKMIVREGKCRLESTDRRFWGSPTHRCIKVIRVRTSWCVSLFAFTVPKVIVSRKPSVQSSSVHEMAFEIIVANSSEVEGACTFDIPLEITLDGPLPESGSLDRTGSTSPISTPPIRPASFLSRSPNRQALMTDDTCFQSPPPTFVIPANSAKTIYGKVLLPMVDRSLSHLERKLTLINLANPFNVPEIAIIAEIPTSIWQFSSDSHEHVAHKSERDPFTLPPLMMTCTRREELSFIDKKLTVKCNAKEPLVATFTFISPLDAVVDLSVLKYTSTLPMKSVRFGPDRTEREIRVRASVKPTLHPREITYAYGSQLFSHIFNPETCTYETALNIERQRSKPTAVIPFGYLTVSTEGHMDDHLPIQGSLLPPSTFEITNSNIVLKKHKSAQELIAMCEIANKSTEPLSFTVFIYTCQPGLQVYCTPNVGEVQPLSHFDVQVVGRLVSGSTQDLATTLPDFLVVVVDSTCNGNVQVAKGSINSELQPPEVMMAMSEKVPSASDGMDSDRSASEIVADDEGVIRVNGPVRLAGCTPLRVGNEPMTSRYLVTMPSVAVDGNASTHDLTIENTSASLMEFVIALPSKRQDRSWLQLSRESGRVRPGERIVVKLQGSSKVMGSYSTYLVITMKNPVVEVITVRVTLEVMGTSSISSSLFDVMLDTRQVIRSASGFDFGEVFYGNLVSHRFIDIINRTDLRLDLQCTFGTIHYFLAESDAEMTDVSARPKVEVQCSLSGTTFKSFGTLRLEPKQQYRVYLFFTGASRANTPARSVRVETELLVKCRTARECTRVIPVRASLMHPCLTVPSTEIIYYHNQQDPNPQPCTFVVTNISSTPTPCEVRGLWHWFAPTTTALDCVQETVPARGALTVTFSPNMNAIQEHLTMHPASYLEEFAIVYNGNDLREKHFVTFRVVSGLIRRVPWLCFHGSRANVAYNRLEDRVHRVLTQFHGLSLPWESQLRFSLENWIRIVSEDIHADDPGAVMDEALRGTVLQEVEDMYKRIFETPEGVICLRNLRYTEDLVVHYAMTGRPNIHFLDLAVLLFHGIGSLAVFSMWKDSTVRVLRDRHIVPKVVREFEQMKTSFNQQSGGWEMEI